MKVSKLLKHSQRVGKALSDLELSLTENKLSDFTALKDKVEKVENELLPPQNVKN